MTTALEPIYRQVGRSYKVADVKPDSEKSKSVLLDYAKVLVPDETTMSASAVISTPAPDRVSDSMLSLGCKLDNYRKNPVVFWEHGFGGITLPIAKSEDQDGNLTVQLTNSAVLATAYFTDAFLEAEQIFDLVVQGFIRATSIRFDPIKLSIREEDGERFYIYEEWDLEEWSWVTVPCNPEAVRGVVSKNRLAGKPIAEPILKSLQALSPNSPVVVRGWSPEPIEVKKMEKTPEEIAAEAKTKADEAEAARIKKEADDKAAKEAKEKEAKQAKDDEEELCDKPKSLNLNVPFGQHLLTNTFKSASELVASVEGSVTTLENAKVREGLEAAVEMFKSAIGILEGAYVESYPKAEVELKYDPSKEDAQEILKNFLHGSSGRRLILKGQSGKLRNLIAADNLNAEQRKVLGNVSEQIDRVIRDAEATKVAPKTEETSAEDDAKLKQAMADLQKMKSDVKEILPFQKTA